MREILTNKDHQQNWHLFVTVVVIWATAQAKVKQQLNAETGLDDADDASYHAKRTRCQLQTAHVHDVHQAAR